MKCAERGSLEQQTFIVIQFWRPEVQNPGVGRIVLEWIVVLALAETLGCG